MVRVTDGELEKLLKNLDDPPFRSEPIAAMPREVLKRALEELRTHRQHKNLTSVEWKKSPDDVERLASLYTHDMALPYSTNGEVAMGRALQWAAERIRRYETVIGYAASFVDSVKELRR